MDPHVTLRNILRALIDGDRTQARMNLQALHDWLRHDGFMLTAVDVAQICTEFACTKTPPIDPGKTA